MCIKIEGVLDIMIKTVFLTAEDLKDKKPNVVTIGRAGEGKAFRTKNMLLEALNFKVKSIETFLDIPFQGISIADKQDFVAQHWEERVKVTDKLLSDSYEEYLSE